MNLMMGSRHIMLFSAGPVNPLIPEHVAQDFGATLHAATPCEAYRVGLYDILEATHCVRACLAAKPRSGEEFSPHLRLLSTRGRDS